MPDGAIIQRQSKPAEVVEPPQEEQLFVAGSLVMGRAVPPVRYAQQAQLSQLRRPASSGTPFVVSFESVARMRTLRLDTESRSFYGFSAARDAESTRIHRDLAEASFRSLPAD